jgi:hypothetical protein
MTSPASFTTKFELTKIFLSTTLQLTMAALLATDFVLFVVTAALFTWHKKASAAADSSSSTSTEKSCDALSNSAFVFIKPHANTAATQTLVREKLVASGITILSESEIDGKTIDEKKVRVGRVK